MQIWDQFVSNVDGFKLTTLAILILVNIVLGLALAVSRKDITLSYVADFCRSRVLPFVLGYLTVGIVGTVDDSLKTAIPVVWGFITAGLVGYVLANLKELGFPLPDILAGKLD